MKAIDTSYKGYRFRSRTEARWAIFFDAVGISYQYEPEGFDLGEHGCYLPDFRIPSVNAWVEIKGVQPTAKEFELAYRLHEQHNELNDSDPATVYCLYGQMRDLIAERSPARLDEAIAAPKMMVLCGSPGDNLESHMVTRRDSSMKLFGINNYVMPDLVSSLGGNPKKILEAINKSRSARFEFGYSQKPWSK